MSMSDQQWGRFLSRVYASWPNSPPWIAKTQAMYREALDPWSGDEVHAALDQIIRADDRIPHVSRVIKVCVENQHEAKRAAEYAETTAKLPGPKPFSGGTEPMVQGIRAWLAASMMRISDEAQAAGWDEDRVRLERELVRIRGREIFASMRSVFGEPDPDFEDLRPRHGRFDRDRRPVTDQMEVVIPKLPPPSFEAQVAQFAEVVKAGAVEITELPEHFRGDVLAQIQA